MECAGELALDGKLRVVPGVLPFALATRRANKALIVPRACADEAALEGDLPSAAYNTLTFDQPQHDLVSYKVMLELALKH